MAPANGALASPRKRRRVEVGPEPDYLRMILKAPVYDVASETPLSHAPQLSVKTGNTVYLKREDGQAVFSFKIRGAYNKMVNLPDEELAKGVLACSAGNHAQGVAASAKKLGTTSTICMPTCTPDIKIESVRAMGGEVLLKGKTFDEAKAECLRLHRETGRPIIAPFDDPFVIAGQGTIAVEIFRQMKTHEWPEYIFTAVGGGGLIAGITAYTKRLHPNVKVIGVEAVDAAAMKASLEAGRVVTLDTVGVFAEGAAVKTVGAETFRVASAPNGRGIDGVVTVTNDEICAAIKGIFDDTRTIVEGAGALSVAGMSKYFRENGLQGKRVVCVTSGANLNFNRLRFVAERAEMGERREALVSVIIPEEKGAFKAMYRCIAPLGITEFSYRFRPGGKAFILVGVSVGEWSRDVPQMLEKLNKAGMPARDVTDNELAKSHGRYLIGGRNKVEGERLVRFEFPEAVDSLAEFILKLQTQFNISLLHYRKQGGGTGKVLVGMTVPSEAEEEFEAAVRGMGYPYFDESKNPVYLRFLR